MNLNIEYRQTEIDTIHAEIWAKSKESPKQKPSGNTFAGTDDDLLKKAIASKNGDKIQRLFNGDYSDYPSQSDADQALCNFLAFWFNKDYSRIDAIFRQSGLFRQKWDEKHYSDGEAYGQHTINKAIADTSDTFQNFKERPKEEKQAKAAAVGISTNDGVQAAFDRQKGCADLFVKFFKDKYRYDHAAGVWMVWNVHYWKTEDIGEPLKDCDAVLDLFELCREELQTVKAELLKTKREDDPEVKAIDRKIKAVSEQVTALKVLSYRKQVIEFAAVGPGSLGTSGDTWDSKPWLLPCKNGVGDLKTGILRPGRQSDMLKTYCPTNFNGQAICPQWERMFLAIFNDDLELICFIQRLFGMSLIGEVVEHVLPIFYGAGRNGKDTILEALRHVLGGDMAGPVRSEMLLDSGMKKNAGAPNSEVMGLRGRRLVWASETNEGRKLDASTVKELTGGGWLSGRVPYGKREVSFKPSHLLLLMTNSKPRANADDYALWKRLLLIAFTISFVDNPKEPHERKRDKDLPEKLKSEAEGILAWLVRGCLDYQTEGLNPPESVIASTRGYQKDEDLINQFLDDRCVTGPECWVSNTLLYLSYQSWAIDNGLKPMSGIGFGRKIGKKFESSSSRDAGKIQKGFKGVGLIV